MLQHRFRNERRYSIETVRGRKLLFTKGLVTPLYTNVFYIRKIIQHATQHI